MKVKIIVSNSKEDHEQSMNEALKTIGDKRKLFFVHKLLKVDKVKDGMRYVAFIHYE